MPQVQEKKLFRCSFKEKAFLEPGSSTKVSQWDFLPAQVSWGVWKVFNHVTLSPIYTEGFLLYVTFREMTCPSCRCGSGWKRQEWKYGSEWLSFSSWLVSILVCEGRGKAREDVTSPLSSLSAATTSSNYLTLYFCWSTQCGRKGGFH